MKECIITPEGAKKIEVMKAADKAFHRDWCDEIYKLEKQLESLAPQILLARLQGKDLLAELITALPHQTDAAVHRETLRRACVDSKVCFQCGGKAVPNVTPSMCEAAYDEGD